MIGLYNDGIVQVDQRVVNRRQKDLSGRDAPGSDQLDGGRGLR